MVFFTAVLVVLCFLALAYIFNNIKANENTDGKLEYLISFSDSKASDTEKIEKIVKALPLGAFANNISINDSKKPYSVDISYGPNSGKTQSQFEEEYRKAGEKKAFNFNATVIFALVNNLDNVNFKIEGNETALQRTQLESDYGIKFESMNKNLESIESFAKKLDKDLNLNFIK